MRRALPLVLAAAAAISCGKKGDPRPPLPDGPARTSDLAAVQKANVAEVTFTMPSLRQDGASLTDLARVVVYRVIDPPPSLTEAAASSGGTGDHAPIAASRRRAQAARAKENLFLESAAVVADLKPEAFPAGSRGSEAAVRDDLRPLLTARVPPRLLVYAIVSERATGARSEISNFVKLPLVVPPAAPTNLLAVAGEKEICLSWNPASADEAGRPEAIAGYRVYRRPVADEEYGAPLNSKPVPTPDFSDTSASYGMTYIYTVTAIAKDHPTSEGLPAIQFGIDYLDVYPPPPVTELDALPEEHLVRLYWTPVSAPDLAGYIVLRADDGAPAAPVTATPVTEPTFVDTGVFPGHVYRYSIVAIDRAGNRSERSPEATARPYRTDLPPPGQ